MRLFFEELLIGFEFKNFLIALAVLFIVYLAWESTYVRDYRVQPNAVLIIENNRRLLVDIGANTQRDLRPGSDWTLEAVQAEATANDRSATGTTGETSELTTDGGNTVQIPEPPPSLEVVIEEVHDLASVRQQLNENAYRTLESFEEGISGLLENNDSGPQQVIRAMDTAEGIRRRRLAFYNQDHGSNETNATPGTSPTQGGGDSAADSRVNSENCSNENNENENKSKAQESTAASSSSTLSSAAVEKDNPPMDTVEAEANEKKDEFRIKLKYLNDDMKLVTGSPNENIGDFKKRNFTLELGAQKFVRLVFNGHVLQPDSKTLQSCGLFDNCVVHCLVHNRNPNAANQNQHAGQASLGADNTSNQNTSTGDANPSNLHGQRVGNFSTHESNNGHLMAMYAGMAFITLSLILCWYCRIQYHVFFSWYSTLVLILVTILFSILGPLLIFIENNEVQQTT